MLVNINEDILKLLELNDLKETESNKELIENVVNAYMVGGIFTAIQQDASEVEEKAVKDLMDHYAMKMLLHSIKIKSERQKEKLVAIKQRAINKIKIYCYYNVD